MSTNRRIYLDHNATAPLAPAAAAAMTAAMAVTGNPSSIHAEGRAARDLVERARNAVAALLGRPREQVVLTSGGTEANALGIAALAAEAEARGLPRTIATTPLEHPSIRGPVAQLVARGWTVVPDAGSVAAYALVNHELGSIHRLTGQLVHVDAVQAAGKLSLHELTADSVAISAHKLGGPQGAGALALTVTPPETGGHQERGRRAGTENVIGIAGFGAAAELVTPATWPAVAALGAHLEAGLAKLTGVTIHGADLPRVGGTINAGFAGALGESIVIALDLDGIAASTGAACTSGSVQPSPVLLGLGLPVEAARSAVRFSLGRGTTLAEIDAVLAVLPGIYARARGATVAR